MTQLIPAYTDEDARGAINDIFGADGKADKDIDLDTFKQIVGRSHIGHVVSENDFCVTQNLYYDAPNWRYIDDGFGVLVMMRELSGCFEICIAPDGLADAVATATRRFRLDPDGNISDCFIASASPLMIPHTGFHPAIDTIDWNFGDVMLQNNTLLTQTVFVAPIIVPNGVTVSRLILYGFRDDAAASMTLYLKRHNRVGTANNMASLTCDWTSGYSSMYTETITNPVIDNGNYAYFLRLILDPNDNTNDVGISAAGLLFGP